MSREVVLIGSRDCHLCEQAKEVLGRLRDDGLVHVREVPLGSEEGRRLALAAGALFPPVVLLDGHAFSHGRLSERKLRKALAARPQPGAPPEGRRLARAIDQPTTRREKASSPTQQ